MVIEDRLAIQIRTDAARISSDAVSRLVSAIIIHHGEERTKEMSPLAFAPAIERYILTGEMPGGMNIFMVRR